MLKRYQGKHFKQNTESNCMRRILILVLILAIMASYVMSGILSYFSASASITNTFTIAGKYTVIFDANGGSGTMPNQEVYIGQTVALDTNQYTQTGYSFMEWNTQADGQGTSYADEADVTNLAAAGSSIRLYAQWDIDSNEAEIVGVGRFATVQAAMTEAARLGGHQTVKLLKDVELTSAVTVARNANITFNLQNFTLSNTHNHNINNIQNNGTLEIIAGANGAITNDSTQGAINNNASGNLTIRSGSVTATGTKQAVYNAGGTVEITGTAQLSTAAPDRAAVHNSKPNNGNAGTITISGGTITSTVSSTKGAVENDETGTLIVTGGTIISNNSMGIDNKATLVIGDQDDDPDVTTPIIQGATYGVSTSGTATVEFYNGTVKGITNAFSDENAITDFETNCDIDHSTETIGGNTYQTAYLEVDRVSITFDANGGTPAQTTVHVPINTAIGANMPQQNPTRAHYTFDGWYTSASGGNQVTSATVITAADTYYAHWTQVEAEVTFNANGGTIDGTNVEDIVVVNIGSSVGANNLPTPQRHYKTFVGWFTDPDPTLGTQIYGTETITQDVTYYAHWTALNVTVNFDPSPGTMPQADASRIVAAGDQVGPLPTSATRSGYGFAGWYTDPDPSIGTRIDETEEIGDTTVTFYAQWISNPVARIGAIHYASLQDAIDDVPADNTETTITLLQTDLEAVCILDTDKNIVLDLNGYTLYNNGSKKTTGMDNGDLRTSVIENLGTLRITNGTINTSKSNQAAINTGTGTVIIDNATVTNTGTANNQKKQAIYVYSGDLIVTGNSIITANNTGAYGGYDRGAIQVAGGTATILSGTITSTEGSAIVNQANATLILGEEDGTADNTTPVIQGKTYGVKTSGNGSVFNFYDGIVKGITGSISGTVADYETGTSRTDSTEVIGSDTYNTTCYQ